MKIPLVSIIMAVRDGGAFLDGALASIRSQTFQDFQTIVIGAGSPALIEEQVRAELPDALVLREPNGGPAAARNLGLTRAMGKLVAFLDADDVWENEALSQLVRAFRTAPSVGVVQGLVRRFGVTDDSVAKVPESPHAGFDLGALMIRKDAIDQIGIFDPTLPKGEDVDYFIRMKECGIKRLVIPNIVLHRRVHPGSVAAISPATMLKPSYAADWMRLIHASLARRRARPPEASIASTPSAVPKDITVALVVRQGIRFLPTALESIRRQTLPPSEIIAVVGESTDGTLGFLRSQSDVRCVEQVGSGLAAARNQAVRAARGRYVAFLDHDDLWWADKLFEQARSISVFTEPAACITSFRESRDNEHGGPSRSGASYPFPGIGWTPSALLAHREVFQRVGDFDPALGPGCDTDWFRRLRTAGIPISLATLILLHKRRRADSLGSDAGRNRAAMLRMIAKHRTELRRNGSPEID